MECGEFYKIYLVTTSVIALFGGAAAIVLGVLSITLAELPLNVEDQLHPVLALIIGVGALLFLLGLTGCCGPCYELIWMLYICLVMSMILMLCEVGAAAGFFVLKSKLKDIAEENGCESCGAAVKMIIKFMMPGAGILLAIIIIEIGQVICCWKVIKELKKKNEPFVMPSSGPQVTVMTTSDPGNSQFYAMHPIPTRASTTILQI